MKAAIEIVHGHDYQQDLVILLKHCVVICAVVLSQSCIGASRSSVTYSTSTLFLYFIRLCVVKSVRFTLQYYQT